MSALSEVETHDGLTFMQGRLLSRQDDKQVAPSIDDVDNDPELLRNLRGQGRYFGVEDDADAIHEAEAKCKNCSQRGHIKKNCPHVICSYCGLMDDHYSQHCPRTMRCSHCNDSGHYRQNCPQKWKRIYCTLCNSKKHSRDRCPSVWRSYCLRGAKEKRVLASHKIFCYNCAGKGHFGDDCPQARSSRVPNDDGSAFSGDNLAGELRADYFTNLTKWHQEAREALDEQVDDYNINYDDYEIDEAQYSNSAGRKSKKRKRNPRNSQASAAPQRASLPAPVSKGRTLNPPEGRRHPLDFPRNGPRGEKRIAGSRYGSPAPYHSDAVHKPYNPYQPFRSGTLSRRR
ncbi:ACL040Cp [Eremothecium gossypii ATCC 10895]|uniref:ACL040Cp n=1 Tax=Eremothecium gossypii (strain ATCC 10895 / CBS 109.51 / FGSC 9923 / NRRL Y-1056) TaxID=284811 RepID=Q75CF9_EREGS|nr:ACL040Cp [Eremothecium gossypii ATCC 10895]AAS51188.1 ACL040Cp [Eremothecium gossypii ATCC 10895]AEY95479.1 FACL040Cp [Eremothecium gossypii FDAG1]